MSDCGCKWDRHPIYGDIVVEQCADHARDAADITRIAVRQIQEHLDRELDAIIAGRQ